MHDVFHLKCHNMSTAFLLQESFIFVFILRNKQPNNELLIEHVN